MNDLVESIKVYQTINGVNDSQFSKLLNIDPSTWAKIKSGERNPGLKFYRGLAKIPELEFLVYTSFSNSVERPPEPFSGSLGSKAINYIKRLIKGA